MNNIFKTKKIKLEVEGNSLEILIPRSKRIEKVIRRREFTSKKILETRELFKLIGEPRNIVDIGANIGYLATHYQLAANPDVIYCFEPSSINYGYLKKNTLKYKNIFTFNTGLSDKKTSAVISMPSENQNIRVLKAKDNTGFLSMYGESNVKSEKIELTSLDLWQEKENVDLSGFFIKIDVEGNELNVLKGAGMALKRNNTFQIEFNPACLNMSGTTSDEIIQFMDGYNYVPFIFIDGQLEKIKDKHLFENVVDVIFKKK